MENLHRRLGKFKISDCVIRENPQYALLIMSKVIVVKAERLWINDAIEYIAMSELFQPLAEGTVIPEYNLRIENDTLIVE